MTHQERMQGLRKKLEAFYQRIHGLTGGRLDVISESVRRFVALQGLETAATLAWYALFSLFPLMLVLVAVLGYLLESSEQAYMQTIIFIGNALPVSFTMVQDNLRELLTLRGRIGIIGLIGALWSASSFFTILARTVNRAWPSMRLRNVVQVRLIGLAMVGSLFLLMLFSLFSSAFINLVPSMFDSMGGINFGLLSPLWQLVLRFLPGIFSFLMFVALYRWVPNRVVYWRAVLQGSLITAVAWESAKFIFGLYLKVGILNYELLYGSLGTVMALMFWIYLSCLITLFGAFLVATLDMRLHIDGGNEQLPVNKQRPKEDVLSASKDEDQPQTDAPEQVMPVESLESQNVQEQDFPEKGRM